jgi:hypothetical protein
MQRGKTARDIAYTRHACEHTRGTNTRTCTTRMNSTLHDNTKAVSLANNDDKKTQNASKLG